MEQLMIVNTLDKAREAINNTHTRVFTGFIELGYIFRQVSELKLYAEGGYESLADFVKAEYGYERSQVSRFMSLNEKYSKNGNTPYIDDKWAKYSQTALYEIMQLPDEIQEHIDPDAKRDDIREIKKEYAKAEEIGNEENFVAVMSGDTQDPLTKNMPILIETLRNRAKDIYDQLKNPGTDEDIRVAFAPSGFSYKRAGSTSFFFKQNEVIATTNGDSEKYSYHEFIDKIKEIHYAEGQNFDMWYEVLTGEKYDVKMPTEYVKNAASGDFVDKNVENEDENATKSEVDNTLQVSNESENYPQEDETPQTEDVDAQKNDNNKAADISNKDEKAADTSADETDTPDSIDVVTAPADEATTSNDADEAAVHIIDCDAYYQLKTDHHTKRIFIMTDTSEVGISDKINYCPVCGKKL